MGKCIPGTPCWTSEGSPIVYKTYPEGCTSSTPSPYTLPIRTEDVYYSGSNMAASGSNTNDLLTDVLQKIDAKIDPATMLEAIIAIINTNATLKSALCTALSDCP